MCNSLRNWMVLAVLAASACSGNLVLPGDDSPGGDPPGDNSPAALTPISGNGQEGRIGSVLDPLVVQVTDASSQPIEGVAVEFQFDGSVPDAVITPRAITDGNGKAAAEVRLGTEAGEITVLAQVSQASELQATFGLTAVAKGKKGKGGGRDRDDDDDDDED
jgi:Bacterial Ig-like domain (group 1)